MDRLKLLIPILLLMLLTPALAVDSRTVTDDLGRNVTITGVPNRIVCICPSCTEIAYSLGLGDKVVGVDRYSDYPPEVVEKQLIGSCWKPDPEEVASLKPDLVIMYSFMGKGDPSVKQLEDAGLTVIALHPGNL
ncbi:MAG: ABC transporter substrate-binding protein, partial [Thaumarchaeota archaeon]|nr:ABC transporter substrate-binding protein [Nitrososphaerota archaeon]